MANTIRPHAATSLRMQGEVQTRIESLQKVGHNPVADRASHGSQMILGAHHAGRAAEKSGDGMRGVFGDGMHGSSCRVNQGDLSVTRPAFILHGQTKNRTGRSQSAHSSEEAG